MRIFRGFGLAVAAFALAGGGAPSVGGAVAQSLLAKADVILHRIEPLEGEGGPVFDVYVARSFADYLWGWLEDAVQEYGPS